MAAAGRCGRRTMDFYGLLGLSRSASSSEVKAAFKKKAVEHHPDK